MTEPLSIMVPGLAAGLTAPPRVGEEWKTAVALALRAKWDGDFCRDECAVDMSFHLPASRFAGTAVFNLLKSTLDGLSSVAFAPSNVARPSNWDREDWRITRLTARKLVAQDEPFVAITFVSGNVNPPTRLPTEPVVRVSVLGSPPLWPGDAAGQRKVLVHRDLLKLHINALSESTSDATLAMSFRFAVEPARFERSDLDNFCVPAAQAVCSALYGDLSHGGRIATIVAEKVRAPTADDAATDIAIWFESDQTTDG